MIQQFDWTVLYAIQDIFKCQIFDILMPAITPLGTGGVFWIAIAAMLLYRRETRQTGFIMCCAMLFCLIFGNLMLKNLIARPRPYTLDPNIVLLTRPSSEAYSFPSGHTMNAFSAAAVLFIRKVKFRHAALVLAFLIAFTRLYLMMHFPTDILGGIVVGVFSAYLCCKYLPIVLEKKKDKGNAV